MTYSLDSSMMMCPEQVITMIQFIPVRNVFVLRLVCKEWNEIISKQWASRHLDLASVSKEIYTRRSVWPIEGWWSRTLRNCTSVQCDRELKWPLSDFVDQLLQMENTLTSITMNCVIRSELLIGVRSYAEGDPIQICNEAASEACFCCSCWSPIKVFKPNFKHLKHLEWKVRELKGVVGRVQFVNPPLVSAKELPSLEYIRLTWRTWQVLAAHSRDWYEVPSNVNQIREAQIFGCWDRQKLSVFRKCCCLNITGIYLKTIGDLRSFIDTASAIGIMKKMGLNRILTVNVEELKVGIPSEDWEYFYSVKEGLEKYVFTHICPVEGAISYFEDYYDEACLANYYKGAKQWTDTLLPLILAYVQDHDVSKCAAICASYIDDVWERIRNYKKPNDCII